MQIYLLRHGIAEDLRHGLRDADRALTSEGEARLQRVLKRAQAKPTLILSSPYLRARQTARIAAEILEYAGKIVETEALTPHGAPAGVWQELRARPGEAAVLLAGHEPLMSSLAAFLLNSPTLAVDMKKAALLRIDCDRLGPNPSGVLKWMLTPAVAGA